MEISIFTFLYEQVITGESVCPGASPEIENPSKCRAVGQSGASCRISHLTRTCSDFRVSFFSLREGERRAQGALTPWKVAQWEGRETAALWPASGFVVQLAVRLCVRSPFAADHFSLCWKHFKPWISMYYKK